MPFQSRRFMVIRRRMPTDLSANSEIHWLCESIGLFSERDKDSSCYRIFIELLRNSKAEDGLASDAIAFKLQLSRGTVIHHMNKLRDAGLVAVEKNRYFMKVRTLQKLIDQLEADILDACKDMKRVAEDIDRQLGL